MLASTALSIVFLLAISIAKHTYIIKPCTYELNLQSSTTSRKVLGLGRGELVAAAGPRHCETGLQFAAALADQSVEDVLLMSDITLKEADWRNFSSPLKLTRNVTVRGIYENRDNWVILDISYVKNKVQLGAGVSMVLRFLVLDHWREDPLFMAPGMDLIASGPIPERADGLYWPALIPEHVALIQRTCPPAEDQLNVTGTMERPAAFPGNQSSRLNVSQAGCLSPRSSNNKDDPGLSHPTRRCWPLAGVREDVATFASNLDKYGKPAPAGYIVFVRCSDYYCETVMSEVCVKEYTPPGCFWHMFPKNVSGDAPVPPTTQNARKTTSSSSSSRGVVLGGALGGTIGLCVVMLVGAVIAIVMHRHGYRRHRQQLLECAPLGGMMMYYGCDAAGTVVIDNPEDGGKRLIDGSDGSHGRLLTDNGQQHAATALNLADRSQSPLAGPQLRRSDDVPLPAASNQIADFINDPSLVPVTSLTPLHPAINLDIKVDGGEVTLSRVTLGKGGFGRVIKGMYRGIPVAVKLIDDGLWHQSAATKLMPSVEAVPRAALYKSAPIVSVSHPAADNTKVRCSDDIQVAMGGGSIQQQQAVVIRAEASTPQQCGSAERAPSRATRNDDCLTADLCTDNIKRAGAAGSMGRDGAAAGTAIVGVLERGSCENDSRSICSKAIITSCEGAVTANSRKPATGNIRGMKLTLGIHSEETMVTCDLQPPTSSHCRAYTDIVDSILGPSQHQPPATNLLEATLKQEVEVLARCQHPNIVRLLAASLQAPRFCLVMELMETSLDRLLYGGSDAQELLPLNMVLHVGDQIARGLSYLHPTIVHRDLKPANVLISNAGSSRPVIKLADFGLSRLRNTVLVTKNPEVGTAPYVAPEVFDVQDSAIITDRVDVYAFGVILWEMLAGRRPWEGHNMVMIAVLVAMHHRRPPLELVSDERCPPKLRSLIHACWDPDPARRPAAAEIVKALALVQEALFYSTNMMGTFNSLSVLSSATNQPN
ncbi:hypothetical protein VaNZ11_002618 [Volvox africanus]|uniref:Protein kinase domain-containing protein n=1 Tax=Volvox africanus TaxID=51714 RepID=A0ABQ5RSN1_9CHLO|nr:hypothetical protein VaNZ11_002618 [Volvox africanus]